MGMFDSIKMNHKCPYCGLRSELEAQTKDLSKSLDEYWAIPEEFFEEEETFLQHFKERGKLPEEFADLDKINATVSCKSISCQFDSDRLWIAAQGCPSGFGRTFRAEIPIKDGHIIQRLDNMELDESSEDELNEWKEKYPESYEQLMEKYHHEPIVARRWELTESEKKAREEEMEKAREAFMEKYDTS